MSTFKIDFFELAFLAEVCIPPRPIARTMFWHNLIDIYHDQMTQEERTRLFEWLKPNLDMTDKDCQMFYDRFNPDNQYMVIAETTKVMKIKCFKHNGSFHTSRNRTIMETYIKSVTPLFKED
jgi:hypothetical protein